MVKNKKCLLLAEKCRSIYCILFSPNIKRWKWTRHICSCFISIVVTTMIWWLFLFNIHFSGEANFIILIVMISLIGTGFLFTTSVKCITFLILTGMTCKSGRSYLRALSFAYILSGPIANLAENGGEVVRVFACATSLTYNLTKTRIDLMTKPFQNTLTNMKDNVNDVDTLFKNITTLLEPIRVEVERDNFNANNPISRRDAENMGDQIQNEYSKKFEIRCKRQLAKGKQRCHEAFAKSYLECENKFPRIVRSLLCWPFQVDFICGMNLFGNPNDLCSAREVLPDAFGNSYAQLDDAQKQLHQNGSQVEVKYIMKAPIPQAAQRNGRQFETIKQLKKALLNEWDEINITTLQQFVNSMPNRVSQVFVKKGKHINY